VNLVDPVAFGFDLEVVVLAIPVPREHVTVCRLLTGERAAVGHFGPNLTATQALRRSRPQIHRVAISAWLRLEQALHACTHW
jgi:hypothetical protein